MKPGTHRDTITVERAATAGSFALSYDALHQLAEANQVPKPLAWIWPLIVDGFIIVASLAILHAFQHGRTARYPWALLAGFSTLSVAFNVLHAPPTAIARLVAAIPPLTLVLSFELLMRQLRYRTPAPTRTTTVLASRTSEAQSPTEQLATTDVPAGSHSLLRQAREIHEQNQGDGARLTGKTLGQILGISDGYARRLLREINATQRPRVSGPIPRRGQVRNADRVGHPSLHASTERYGKERAAQTRAQASQTATTGATPRADATDASM